MFKEYTGDLLLTPCPTVLVTVKSGNAENVLAISWTGIACSHPEYVTISVNPKRFSHSMLLESGKFCINIPGAEHLEAVDYCGSYSGRDTDKFLKCGFTKKYVSDCILIEQCKMHILCEVEKILDLGSHHLFVAKVTGKYLNIDENDEIHDILNPIVYYRPYYYKLDNKKLGFYGYTKKENK